MTCAGSGLLFARWAACLLLAQFLLLGAGCTSTAHYPPFKGYAQAVPVTCLVDVTLVARRGGVRVLSASNSISALERFSGALTSGLACRGLVLTEARIHSIGGNHAVQQVLPAGGFPRHFFAPRGPDTNAAAPPALPPPRTQVIEGPPGLTGDDLAGLFRALDAAAAGDRMALPAPLRGGAAGRYLIARLSAEDTSTWDMPGVPENVLRDAGLEFSRLTLLVRTPLRFDVAVIRGDTQEVEWIDHWPWDRQNQIFSQSHLVQVNYGRSRQFVHGPYIALLGQRAADLVPLP